MNFGPLENLLAVRLGFDIQTIGQKAVQAMLARSMDEAGFSDPFAYAAVVARDPEAWSLFVDQVIVPETWFFRDVVPFDLAADLVRARTREHADKPFRVLSCPCSTGEEPYSLVMAMLRVSAPPESFVVEAVDVNARGLDSARAAQYRPRSFRDDVLWYRAAYFERAEGVELWRLNSLVKSLARFREGNLIAPDFLVADEPYDVIFCRNLLIYLLPEARAAAIGALRRLLTENGVLVLGNAEAALAREHGFAPVGPAGAFAFSKTKPKAPHSTPAVSRRSNVSRASHHTLPLPAPISMAPPAPASEPDVALLRDNASLLAAASELGDAGQLEEALKLCGEYLQRSPGSVKGHFLFGVLQDALGYPDLAAGAFRKVLYLDPSHRGALLHLALKREALGDSSGAALLRARARRAPEADVAE